MGARRARRTRLAQLEACAGPFVIWSGCTRVRIPLFHVFRARRALRAFSAESHGANIPVRSGRFNLASSIWPIRSASPIWPVRSGSVIIPVCTNWYDLWGRILVRWGGYDRVPGNSVCQGDLPRVHTPLSGTRCRAPGSQQNKILHLTINVFIFYCWNSLLRRLFCALALRLFCQSGEACLRQIHLPRCRPLFILSPTSAHRSVL